ncbi:ankyrin repeat domain-containing protein [Roseibium sp. SCP14]|uniref:ankyrin repeat domain-containing protein n=1 Tax=Roseibium sp. SCP14 TaxID=3141375 RepID=UPI003336F9B7
MKPASRAPLFSILSTLLVLLFSSPVAAEKPADLLAAAKSGNLAEVQAALTAGVDIETRDSQGQTALLIATRNDQTAVARLLIENGADVNADDDNGNTPFLYAGVEGRADVIKMMLQNGADLKDANHLGGTALTPAAHYAHVETVGILLETDIDVDHINDLGWTALLEAIILGDGGERHTEVVHLLLSAKADPNLADGSGVSPLQHAQQRKQNAIVELLLRAGAKRD